MIKKDKTTCLEINQSCLLDDIVIGKYLEERNFYIDDLYCAEAKESDRCAAFSSTIKFNCLPGYEFENKHCNSIIIIIAYHSL